MPAPRCLIAEDEPLLAEGLRADLAVLWPALQVVAVVGDGQRAAEQTLALQPELCFFDIRMPGCTGLEAAQALAEDWPDGPGAAPFPLLVFVTAYDDHALAAFQAQAVDYLVKPVDRNRLAALVLRQWRQQFQIFADKGFAPFRLEWQRRHVHQGQRVRLLQGESEITGTAEGVDENGALLLRGTDGKQRAFHSGEISLRLAK